MDRRGFLTLVVALFFVPLLASAGVDAPDAPSVALDSRASKTSCPAGKFLDDSTGGCVACSPGTYSVGGGIRIDTWDEDWTEEVTLTPHSSLLSPHSSLLSPLSSLLTPHSCSLALLLSCSLALCFSGVEQCLIVCGFKQEGVLLRSFCSSGYSFQPLDESVVECDGFESPSIPLISSNLF